MDNSCECTCECHTNLAIIHFAPCCDGECPFCGIAYHKINDHIKEKHKEEEECRRKGRKLRWKTSRQPSALDTPQL